MTSPFDSKENLNKRNHPTEPDLSFDSLHHTLGHGATQAAPGNHKHNVKEITGLEETTTLLAIVHDALKSLPGGAAALSQAASRIKKPTK